MAPIQASETCSCINYEGKTTPIIISNRYWPNEVYITTNTGEQKLVNLYKPRGDQHVHTRPHLKNLPTNEISATNPSASAIADFVDDETFGWEDLEELRIMRHGDRKVGFDRARRGPKNRKQRVERKLDCVAKDDLR